MRKIEIWFSNIWFDLSIWGGWYKSYEEKKEELAKHLLMKQFKIIGRKGVKYEDLLADIDWLDKFTITSAQYDEWRNYSIKRIKSKLDLTDEGAEKQFGWFDLGFGLKVANKIER